MGKETFSQAIEQFDSDYEILSCSLDRDSLDVIHDTLGNLVSQINFVLYSGKKEILELQRFSFEQISKLLSETYQKVNSLAQKILSGENPVISLPNLFTLPESYEERLVILKNELDKVS